MHFNSVTMAEVIAITDAVGVDLQIRVQRHGRPDRLKRYRRTNNASSWYRLQYTLGQGLRRAFNATFSASLFTVDPLPRWNTG